MSDKIIILDEYTSNQIAAGEVVERPASVVKELVENALDAHADKIEVEIRNGGIGYIKVSDNAKGIDEKDIQMAFERHGTSKIKRITDLNSISTMGFRGEALPSIASVSKVVLTTKTQDADNATKVIFDGCDIKTSQKAARTAGTTVEVLNLFYNTPARYKFLKNNATEARACIDIVSRLALANTDVSFIVISDKDEVLRTNGDNDLLNCIYAVYGRDIAKDIVKVEASSDKFKVSGYISRPFATRGNRQHQSLFINKRYVKSHEINSAIERGHGTMLMKGRFPFYVLNLDIDNTMLDVNVHPAKTEVRISDSGQVGAKLSYIIKSVLDQVQKPMESFNIKPTFVKERERAEKPDGEVIKSYLDALEDLTIKKDAFGKSDDLADILTEQYILSDKHTGYISKKAGDAGKVPVSTSAFRAKSDTPHTDISASYDDNYEIAGQVLNTYIIIDKFDHILLIDQHAAHEKIYFEQMLSQYKQSDLITQTLLIPEEVVLTGTEKQFMDNNRHLINSFGFDYSDFGHNTIVIREIPSTITGCDIADAFKDMLDDAMSDIKNAPEKAFYSLACKAAIKANKKLDKRQMQYIYETLLKLENPYTCPHGRPTIIKMTRYDLDRMFKRIV